MTQKSKSKIRMELSVDEHLEDSVLGRLEQMITTQLKHELEDKIGKMVHQRVMEMADKEFDKLAKAKLGEFFTKAHQKTDYYGHPTGESESLIQILTKKFEEFLSDTVDEKGNKSTYSGSLKRHQWMLNKLAHEPLQQAIDSTVKGIAAKAKEQIQASVSRYIAEQLSPTISVPALKQ